MNFAPIGIMTYSRIEHLKKTVDSLKNNILAKESELYIFLDAPQKGDEAIVEKVRDYVYTIEGFKVIHIVERKNNNRLQNAILGMQQLLLEHDRYIFMEDDNVVAPSFLTYMNEALEFYKDDEKIFAIGGHTPNLESNKKANKDVYFVKRFHPWGYGMWRHKDIAHEKLPTFQEISKNKKLIKKINQYGNDLMDMIRLDSTGAIDSGDIKYCYYMNMNDKYMVLPTQTLVKNIGLDGSGVHCGLGDKYCNDKLSNKIIFNFTNLYINKTVQKEYKKFYDKPFGKNIVNKIKRYIKRLSK